MPKVKPLIQRPDYSGVEISIKTAMLKRGIRNISKLSDLAVSRLGIARTTLYGKFNKPETFTLGEIKELSIILNTTFEELVGSLFWSWIKTLVLAECAA